MPSWVTRLLGAPAAHWRAILAGLAVGVLLQGSAAQAADLSHFISNLYGGKGITLADTPPPFPTHAHHFTEESIDALNALGSAVASSVNLSSFPSSAVGYTYDIQLGLPVTTTTSLGPILGERAETLGAGKLNIAASYSRVDFTQFNGRSLNNIQLLLAHADVPGCTLATCPFLADQIRLKVKVDLSQDVFALYTTYGLTPNWDVSLILPVVHTHAVATSDASIIFNSAIGPAVHSFVGAPTSPHSVSGGDDTGIGDLLLHTKYNLFKSDANPMLPDFSVVGQLKLPSGDRDNLLGSGSTDVFGGVVLSKQIEWAAPHLNIGYEKAVGGFDKNNFRYAAGADFRVDPRLTTAVDFVGRVYSGRSDLHDVGLGLKWNPADIGIVGVNFLLPLNKHEGLRPDYVASVSYQITF